MNNKHSSTPIVPPKDLISSWNLNILKESVEIQQQATNFQKNINEYSPELQPLLLLLFKKNIASAIFSKIGMSQQILPKEYINLQNTLDAFTYINILLQFFLNTGSTDYYYQLLEIFLHDFAIIDQYVDTLLENTIFFQYKRIDNLKRDEVLNFFFSTNKIEKIKTILNDDTDRLIRIFHQYIQPIFTILNYDHFSNYRGTQYVKYRSMVLDIQHFEKGINNSITKFHDFVLNRLVSYSIYDCYKEDVFLITEETDQYLEGLLNSLKRNLILQSQKLYNGELLSYYGDLKDDLSIFLSQFPFNSVLEENNTVDIDALYKVLHKHKKIIILFTHKNLFHSSTQETMKKIISLYENIHRDSSGNYYIDTKLTYNIADPNALHNKYVGLININQSEDYPAYLLQDRVQLYFHLPVFVHVEIATNPHMIILDIENPYYTAKKYDKGICFMFATIWHFLRYLYKNMEKADNNKIQVMFSVPVKYHQTVHQIRFNIVLENFIFFPHSLPKII